MPEQTCVMTCGCRLGSNEVVRGGKNNTCPNHKHAKILFRVATCVDCGKIYVVGPRVSQRLRCDPCRRDHVREINTRTRQRNGPDRRYQERRKRKIRELLKKQKASAAAWDCLHRVLCLNANQDAECLPCLECDKYTAMSNFARAAAIVPGSEVKNSLRRQHETA